MNFTGGVLLCPPPVFSHCVLFSSCVHVLSEGAQLGAGQSRRDIEVSPEEAAVCLSRRGAAAEDRSQSRRPAADGGRFPPHRGKTLTDKCSATQEGKVKQTVV